jgi:hypothetical protein
VGSAGSREASIDSKNDGKQRQQGTMASSGSKEVAKKMSAKGG